MSQNTPSKLSIFSSASVFAYGFAIFFSAKEFARLPALISEDKSLLEIAALATKVAMPLLNTQAVVSTSWFGNVAVTLLQVLLFINLFLIFFVRFYWHAESIERHYQTATENEPRGEWWLRFIWVFIALNIPNLASVFNSQNDALLLVRWMLASLLLMYVSVMIWHFSCADGWIRSNTNSRLNDERFRTGLKIFDAVPVLTILLSFAATFVFDTYAVGFLAVVVSLVSCFLSVTVQFMLYLSVIRGLIMLLIIFVPLGIFFFSDNIMRLLLSLF